MTNHSVEDTKKLVNECLNAIEAESILKAMESSKAKIHKMEQQDREALQLMEEMKKDPYLDYSSDSDQSSSDSDSTDDSFEL